MPSNQHFSFIDLWANVYVRIQTVRSANDYARGVLWCYVPRATVLLQGDNEPSK